MRPKINYSLPQVIDSTIRSEYVTCHTKGFYSYSAQLGGSTASIDLVAGGAVASGLETIRKLVYGPQKLSLERALEQGCMAALEKYGDLEVPKGKESKSPEKVLESLVAYFTKWSPHEDHLQPHFVGENPSVEFVFGIPLPINHPESGEPFIYAGRFDMLALYRGQLVVLDDKTCGQLGPTWVNKWNLRGQFTGYVWACRQYDYEVIGAIARGIRFTKTPFDVNESFMESLQMRASWQVDAWYEQLLADVEDMVRAWKAGWYNQNLDEACAGFSGCPFQTLCTAATPEDWYSKYGKRIWNPLQKDPYVPPEQKIEVLQLPEGVLL